MVILYARPYQDHTNDYDASTGGKAIKIAHDGGDDLVEGNFTIQVRNATDNGLQMEYTSSFATGDGTLLLNGNSISGGALVTTGDQLVIEDGANDILDDTRYKVIILDTESGDQIASATITVR